MSENIIVDPETASFARQALLKWYKSSSRSFPWRYDTNPYHVLIAEMMLRRTQANQVIDIYQKFIRRYPHIASLDQATEDEIETILYPLLTQAISTSKIW